MRTALKEMARTGMLELLFPGKLHPGERLVERSLAQKLGISRIPLRETMSQLISRGVLVRKKAGGSLYLRMHTAEEASQVFELREAVEVGAVRAACRRASESDLRRLELICEQMSAQVGSYGSLVWANLDKKFHESLIAASHNERFIRDYDVLLLETHALFYHYPGKLLRPDVDKAWAVQHMRAVVKEHLLIVQATRSGDADKAERITRDHINAAAARVIRSILEHELKQKSTKNSVSDQ